MESSSYNLYHQSGPITVAINIGYYLTFSMLVTGTGGGLKFVSIRCTVINTIEKINEQISVSKSNLGVVIFIIKFTSHQLPLR